MGHQLPAKQGHGSAHRSCSSKHRNLQRPCKPMIAAAAAVDCPTYLQPAANAATSVDTLSNGSVVNSGNHSHQATTACDLRDSSCLQGMHQQPPDHATLDPDPSSLPSCADAQWMHVALQQARLAATRGEVPVGAVLVHAGRALATAHNRMRATRNPLAHAEMLCVAQAARRVADWRELLEATIYVTLEPCPMCAGALLQARVGRVVYGARQPRLGAHGSWVQLLPRSASGSSSLINTGQSMESSLSLPASSSLPPSGGGAGVSSASQLQQRQQCVAEGMVRATAAGCACADCMQQLSSDAASGHPAELDGSLAAQPGLAAEVSGQGGQWFADEACGWMSDGASLDAAGDDSITHSSLGSGDLDDAYAGSGSSSFGHAAADADAPRHPFHPTMVVESGCMQDECAAVLRQFFRLRRAEERRYRAAAAGAATSSAAAAAATAGGSVAAPG